MRPIGLFKVIVIALLVLAAIAIALRPDLRRSVAGIGGVNEHDGSSAVSGGVCRRCKVCRSRLAAFEEATSGEIKQLLPKGKGVVRLKPDEASQFSRKEAEMRAKIAQRGANLSTCLANLMRTLQQDGQLRDESMRQDFRQLKEAVDGFRPRWQKTLAAVHTHYKLPEGERQVPRGFEEF